MLSRAFMQKVQQQAGQATNKAVVVIAPAPAPRCCCRS